MSPMQLSAFTTSHRFALTPAQWAAFQTADQINALFDEI